MPVRTEESGLQRYLIRRLLFTIFAIWATVTLAFFFMRAIPGDPVTTLAGRPRAATRTLD